MIVQVQSQRTPDLSYTVDTDAGTCDCPHFVVRLAPQNAQDGGARTCKHINAVRYTEAQAAREQA